MNIWVMSPSPTWYFYPFRHTPRHSEEVKTYPFGRAFPRGLPLKTRVPESPTSLRKLTKSRCA